MWYIYSFMICGSFRTLQGDTETDEGKTNNATDGIGGGRSISRGEKSHLIVWQVQLPLKKGDSIFLPEDMVG